MSYIRSLSNPEGLYIIASMQGRVEIMGQEDGILSLPRHVFETILANWYDRDCPDEIRYKGAWILVGDNLNHFRWRFGYKDLWNLDLYDVTLHYIAQGCSERRKRDKRAKRR